MSARFAITGVAGGLHSRQGGDRIQYQGDELPHSRREAAPTATGRLSVGKAPPARTTSPTDCSAASHRPNKQRALATEGMKMVQGGPHRQLVTLLEYFTDGSV